MKSTKVAKPPLLAGGNPQIAKADGDAPVQAYIAAMPGWKRDVGRRLDALDRSHRPRRAQGGQMELARSTAVEGQGWFLSLHCFTKYVKSGLLPRHVAASCSPRRVEEEGRALPRHPRGRRVRRSSTRRLGDASQPNARLGQDLIWAPRDRQHEPVAVALVALLGTPRRLRRRRVECVSQQLEQLATFGGVESL